MGLAVTVLAVIGGATVICCFGYVVLAAIAGWLYSSAMNGPKRKRRR